MIPHSRPLLPSADEWREIGGSLAPGWIADGPRVREFEQAAAVVLGRETGLFVCSGTAALHLALLAVDVQRGDEVLVPAYCCTAILNAVIQAGASPVLFDCEPGGFNPCAEDAARRKTPRTRAAVVAPMLGFPTPIAPFRELGIPIVEDCAQTFGAGSAEGDLAVASFFATKPITTGHGGVAAGEADRMQRLRDLVEYDGRDDWSPRFNYRTGEPAAALGLWQLARLPAWLARRRELAGRYDAAGPGHWRPPGNGVEPTFYRYPLRVPDAGAAIAWFRGRGIGAARPVYRPLHHYLGGNCPHAEAAHCRLVSLPLYPGLVENEVVQIEAALAEWALSKCGETL